MKGVWSGSEMIVWGGVTAGGDTNTGGRYEPLSDTWTATSTSDAPTGRHFSSAIWTGSEMIIWGGMSGNLDNGTWYDTGGRYNPLSDSWSATSVLGAPSPRIWHVDVWTGEEFIVWGGCSGQSSCPVEVYTGGRYNPASDTWLATSIQSAPSERSNATAVWTGADMMVWSGLAGNVGTYTTSGGFYHVSTVPNNPPVALPDSYSTDEDITLFEAAPGVLGNDVDEDGDPLSALLFSNPVHGELVLSLDGSFSYTPDVNYNGSDSFTYRATDGIAIGDVTAVTLTITAVNDAPLAMTDAYTTTQDTDLTVAAPGVLANDSDIEGDLLSAILSDQPQHGSLVLNIDGSFTYSPDAGYVGSDGFIYLASDGDLSSPVTSVSLMIAELPPHQSQSFFLPLIRR